MTMGQEQGKVEGGGRSSSISQIKNKFRRREGAHHNSLDHAIPEGVSAWNLLPAYHTNRQIRKFHLATRGRPVPGTNKGSQTRRGRPLSFATRFEG